MNLERHYGKSIAYDILTYVKYII